MLVQTAARRQLFAFYVLLKVFRVFVTVNVPSCCAETLIQNAAPLCIGCPPESCDYT
jgi:hypothetical protein